MGQIDRLAGPNRLVVGQIDRLAGPNRLGVGQIDRLAGPNRLGVGQIDRLAGPNRLGVGQIDRLAGPNRLGVGQIDRLAGPNRLGIPVGCFPNSLLSLYLHAPYLHSRISQVNHPFHLGKFLRILCLALRTEKRCHYSKVQTSASINESRNTDIYVHHATHHVCNDTLERHLLMGCGIAAPTTRCRSLSAPPPQTNCQR